METPDVSSVQIRLSTDILVCQIKRHICSIQHESWMKIFFIFVYKI